MAVSQTQTTCRDCGKKPPFLVPTGWHHYTLPSERKIRWPKLCPLCGNEREVPTGNVKLDLDNLKALWSYATSQRERAQIEGKMWELAPKHEKSESGGCARWLHLRIGTPLRGTEARTSLRLSQPDTEQLWQRVDGEERMLLETADKILTRSRVRMVAEDLDTLGDAIKNELTEYDAWPTLVRTDAGNYRKRAGGRVKVGARDRWDVVRAAIWQVIEVELGREASLRSKNDLRGQIEVEISSTIRLIQSRIQHFKKSERRAGAIPGSGVSDNTTKRALRNACQILSVDVPRGKPVDLALYTAAKKNFRRLAHEYHPDVTGSASHERYDEVVEAMQVIEESYQNTNSATKRSTHGDDDNE